MCRDTVARGVQRQICHELRENEFALMRIGQKRKNAKDLASDSRSSNRDQPEKQVLACKIVSLRCAG
jgi:hypothetical protein